MLVQCWAVLGSVGSVLGSLHLQRWHNTKPTVGQYFLLWGRASINSR